MKLAYFDCFSGISGDMTLGALVDGGCPLEHLRSELHGLQVSGWEISAGKVWKNGMAATYVKVKTEDQQKHRSLSAILEAHAPGSRSRCCHFHQAWRGRGPRARRAARKDSFP